MEHSSPDISNHHDNTITIDIRPFTPINMNSTVSFVNEKFVSVQHFPLSKPSLLLPVQNWLAISKMLWMKVVFHPRYLLHLLILLLLVFYLTTFHKKKWKHYIHLLTVDHLLTVAETICKNPSILESVQNIIENGIEEKCKKLCSKTNGSILGYTNYQSMSQFSIDKLWDELVSELPFLVKTLKVIRKDYTDETKHDVKVKLCFIYSVLLNARWFVTFSKN